MGHYTKEAGRCILKDGKPLCTLHGVNPYDPVELDEFTDTVVRAVNAHAAMLEALEEARTRIEWWNQIEPKCAEDDYVLSLINKAITQAKGQPTP